MIVVVWTYTLFVGLIYMIASFIDKQGAATIAGIVALLILAPALVLEIKRGRHG